VLRDSMALRISGVLGASHQHCFFLLQLDHIRGERTALRTKFCQRGLPWPRHLGHPTAVLSMFHPNGLCSA
jgi:hypothetical protein